MRNQPNESPEDPVRITAFFAERLGEPEKQPDEGAQREEARQRKIVERADRDRAWADYMNAQEELPESLNGQDLARMRSALHLTQGDVARIVGVDVGTIEAAERGQHTFADATLRRAAAGFRAALLEGE